MTRKAIYMLGGGIAVCLIFIFVFLRLVFFPGPKEIAEPVPLPRNFVIMINGVALNASVEKAFYVSSHGGWHGDGTDITAYKITGTTREKIEDQLRQAQPAYTWIYKDAKYDMAFYGISHLLPDEFTPNAKMELLLGQPNGELPIEQYYFDPTKFILYSIRNSF